MHYLPSLKQIHIEEFVELHGEFYHSLNFTHVYEDEEVKTCQHLSNWKQTENKLFSTQAGDIVCLVLKKHNTIHDFAQLL